MYSFYCFIYTCLRLTLQLHSSNTRYEASVQIETKRNEHASRTNGNTQHAAFYDYYYFILSSSSLFLMFAQESFKFRNAFRICVRCPLCEFNAMSIQCGICVCEKVRFVRLSISISPELRLPGC